MELPQEIMDKIQKLYVVLPQMTHNDIIRRTAATKGATIATAHYVPQLTAKDARIAELEADNKKLKGLMKQLHADTWQMSGKPRDIGWSDFCKTHNITP